MQIFYKKSFFKYSTLYFVKIFGLGYLNQKSLYVRLEETYEKTINLTYPMRASMLV